MKSVQAPVQCNPRRPAGPHRHSLGPEPLPNNLPLLLRAQPSLRQLTSPRRPSHIRPQRAQTGEPCRARRTHPRWRISVPVRRILSDDHTLSSCFGSPRGGCVDVLRDGGCHCVSGAIYAQMEKQLARVRGFRIVERGGCGVRAESYWVYLWDREGG